MDARKKGDIYWRKLKRYLAAKESRNITSDSEDSDQILAKEIFNLATEVSNTEAEHFMITITGDEFKVMPPTATGSELFKEGILNVIRNLKMLDDILQDPSSGNVPNSDPALQKQISGLSGIVAKALKTYYNSAGIDDKTGESIPDPFRKQALEDHRGIITEYSSAVKAFRKDISFSLIKKYVVSIASEEVPVSATEPAFNALKQAYPKEYKEHSDVLKKISDEYLAYKQKQIALQGSLRIVKTKLRKISEDQDWHELLCPNDVFNEYRNYLDEELLALSYAENCCLSYAKYLLTGNPADPLTASYISKHWKKSVTALPSDIAVCNLPGCIRMRLLQEDGTEYHLEEYEDFLRIYGELVSYMEEHPGLFELQTISAIYFETPDLPVMLNKAKSLRNAISASIADELSISHPEEDSPDIRQMWIDADAFVRVTTLITEYAMRNEMMTINELLNTFADDTYFMSYSRQRRLSESSFDKMMARRAV